MTNIEIAVVHWGDPVAVALRAAMHAEMDERYADMPLPPGITPDDLDAALTVRPERVTWVAVARVAGEPAGHVALCHLTPADPAPPDAALSARAPSAPAPSNNGPSDVALSDVGPSDVALSDVAPSDVLALDGVAMSSGSRSGSALDQALASDSALLRDSSSVVKAPAGALSQDGVGGRVSLVDGGLELKRMYVAPAFRGAGVARALLASAEEEARARGVGRVVLQTGPRQPDAIRMYEREGYRPIPILPGYEKLTFSICMEKRLD